MNRAGLGFTLLAALGFGAVSILTSLATAQGVSLATVLTWRYVLASVILVGWVGSQEYRRMPGAEVTRWLVLGGGGQALLVGMALSALRWIPAATLAFLFYTYPAWVTAVQLARRAEPIGARPLAALGLSLAGTAVLVGSPLAQGALPWQGVALALGAAIVYGAYIPLMSVMQKDHPVPMTSAYAKIGSAACFLALSLYDRSFDYVLPRPAWWAIVALTLVSTVLPGVFFLMGLQRLGPVRTAIVSTIEPFLTALLALVVLRQPLGPMTLLGGAMIVGAVVLLQARQAPPRGGSAEA